jgi:hypothetical protein
MVVLGYLLDVLPDATTAPFQRRHRVRGVRGVGRVRRQRSTATLGADPTRSMGSNLAIDSEFEAAGGRGMWRVRNVPLPEPHLLGMAIGGWLHHLRPWKLPDSRNISRLVGCSLIALGTCVIATLGR